MNSDAKDKLVVALSVTSNDLGLTDLNEMIGLEGAQGWSKGDRYKKGNGTEAFRKFSKWEIAEKSNDVTLIEALVEEIFSKIYPLRKSFLQLPENAQVEFKVWFDWHPGDRAFGLHLEEKFLRLLTEIKASIDIDTSVIIKSAN